MPSSSETAYFSKILDDSLPELPAHSPAVLFFDGVGVTRDRRNYDLTKPEYSYAILGATRKLCGETPHTCFQISDEISIIFPDISSFASQINVHYLTHDEICGLAVQTFSEEFSVIYGERARFHVRVHSIKPEDVSRYIAWRKEYTKKAVYTYFLIHEGKWNGAYGKYRKEELLSVIMREGLYKKLLQNRKYVEGIFQNNHGFPMDHFRNAVPPKNTYRANKK